MRKRRQVQIICGAGEPLPLSEQPREEEREYNCEHGSPDEPFPRLVRRKGDEGRRNELSAKGDAAKVRRHVVHDNCRHGEEEPKQTRKRSRGKELQLENNQEHGGKSPHQLTQLKSNETLLEGKYRWVERANK